MASGRTLAPEDAAPPLEWEAALWWLYQRVRTQWRMGFAGPVGLDYGPPMRIAEELGWPLTTSLELLQAVEEARLEAWREQRQPGQG